MFDIGAQELLLTAVVAVVVIGPKDLPRALRLAGSWIAKVRRVSGHFKSGIEEMIRQAELEEMEKKWREKNEAIMQEEAAREAAAASAAAVPAEATLPDHPPAPMGEAPAAHPDYPDYGDQAHPLAAPLPAAHEPAADQASPELPLAPPAHKS
ncbi:MAG: Sec-independent protein translocase protein TatB [Novosphingobium sp.]